jgi:glycosyltransferase involved in cell wall biosynthesis
VSDQGELREWLAASDAFLFTSRADNQPLSIMESLACGTPIYGWATGGAVDMVANGSTGNLLPSQSVSALAASLEDDFLSGRMGAMRLECRRTAVSEFGEGLFADRHLQIYARHRAEINGTIR